MTGVEGLSTEGADEEEAEELDCTDEGDEGGVCVWDGEEVVGLEEAEGVCVAPGGVCICVSRVKEGEEGN